MVYKYIHRHLKVNIFKHDFVFAFTELWKHLKTPNIHWHSYVIIMNMIVISFNCSKCLNVHKCSLVAIVLITRICQNCPEWPKLSKLSKLLKLSNCVYIFTGSQVFVFVFTKLWKHSRGCAMCNVQYKAHIHSRSQVMIFERECATSVHNFMFPLPGNL